MTRRLVTSVLAGGVVYPAGTPETEDLAERVTNPKVWNDEPSDFDPDPDLTHPNALALRELVEYLAELHLADQDTTVPELLRSAVEVFGVPDAGSQPTPPQAPAPAPAPAPSGADTGGDGSDAGVGDDQAAGERLTSGYDAATIPKLQAEIDARNGGRAAADRIMPVGKNKPDLVAALTADDETPAGD